jgi:hypothetical protein
VPTRTRVLPEAQRRSCHSLSAGHFLAEFLHQFADGRDDVVHALGARCQVPGARCQVPGARCQVTRRLLPGLA